MQTYFVTFYTHTGALLSNKALQKAGLSSRMMPVPRALSSSCGTCVRYESEAPRPELLDSDTEGHYLLCGKEYLPLPNLR